MARVDRKDALTIALGLALTPAVVGTAAYAAPRTGTLPGGGFLEIAILSVTLVTSSGLAAGVALAWRASLWIAGSAAALLVAMCFVRFSTFPAVVVAGSLAAVGAAIGGAVGQRIEHPGHLLPACVVAACADVASVIAPRGVTNAIAHSERALSVVAVSFPIFGSRELTPVVGLGDLVFISILLGAARAHGLSRFRMAIAALVGLIGAIGLSAVVGVPVPALPTIALAVVASIPATRRLRPRDRATARACMAFAAAVAIAGVASRFAGISGGGAPRVGGAVGAEGSHSRSKPTHPQWRAREALRKPRRLGHFTGISFLQTRESTWTAPREAR